VSDQGASPAAQPDLPEHSNCQVCRKPNDGTRKVYRWFGDMFAWAHMRCL